MICCDNISGNGGARARGSAIRGRTRRGSGGLDRGRSQFPEPWSTASRRLPTSAEGACRAAYRAMTWPGAAGTVYPVGDGRLRQRPGSAGAGVSWRPTCALRTGQAAPSQRRALQLAYLGLLAGVRRWRRDGRRGAGGVRARSRRQDIAPGLTPPRAWTSPPTSDPICPVPRSGDPAPSGPDRLGRLAELPYRLIPAIADALAGGRPLARLCVPLAAWMLFVRLPAA